MPTRRSRPYQLQFTQNRRLHAISSLAWHTYLAAGLIVVSDNAQRIARLRDCDVKAYWVENELVLFDHGTPVATNAQVIDRLWVLADAGEVSLTEDERRAIQAIRAAWGENPAQPRHHDKPGTRALVDEYLSSQRVRRIEADLYSRRKTQIVVRRGLIGAGQELQGRVGGAA